MLLREFAVATRDLEVEVQVFLSSRTGGVMLSEEFAIASRGGVSDAVVMENRGFGFVTFEDPTAAQKFLEVRWWVVQKERCKSHSV